MKVLQFKQKKNISVTLITKVLYKELYAEDLWEALLLGRLTLVCVTFLKSFKPEKLDLPHNLQANYFSSPVLSIL